MATDYLSATTNRIIAILVGNGSTFFAKAIAPGNRYAKMSGVKWPMPPNPNSRNKTQFIIDVPDFRVLDRNAMKTFTNARSAVGDVVVVKEHTFLFTFVYEGLDRTTANGMQAFIDGVLLADPTLGLTSPPVRVSGQMRGTIKEENTPLTGGSLGLVQRINFPVTFELHRADLIAAAAYTGA